MQASLFAQLLLPSIIWVVPSSVGSHTCGLLFCSKFVFVFVFVSVIVSVSVFVFCLYRYRVFFSPLGLPLKVLSTEKYYFK